MIKSVYESQDEILSSILSLHCPEGFCADLTFGNGSFWKNHKKPNLCFDIQPLQEDVIQASSCSLPIKDSSLKNIVFDPPFLTYVKGGRGHKEGKVAMTARFGGYWSYDDLSEHYMQTIKECNRVLVNNGKLVVKCQDIIHNHKMHCTHYNVIKWAEENDFRLLDLFVLVAKHRMPSPQKGIQKHARIFHSYFLIFQKKEK